MGDLKLNNRVIMAPLTRCRSNADRSPNELMAEYYTQRATAGMIITEATSITPMGVGYPLTPGIWLKEHIAGWKNIVDKVHAAGGTILLQLWHVGRISHPIYLNEESPVSASAVKPAGRVSLLRPKSEYVVPRALEISEIKEIINDYKQAALNAKEAGFDGVEIHGANGYLLDQFLQDSTNRRDDIYGGSLENRARLMLEVTDAVCDVWGPGRVGMHLAPRGDLLDMGDSALLETFTYVAKELGKRKIAFIFSRAALGDDNLSNHLKNAFGGKYIINQQLTKVCAEKEIESGHADAAGWGQLYIANPDLVERFAKDAELNVPKPDQFYLGNEEGYTDYQTLKLSKSG